MWKKFCGFSKQECEKDYLAGVLLKYLKDDSVKAFTLRLPLCIILSGKRQMNAQDCFLPLHENLEEKLASLSKHFVVLHQESQDGIVVFVLGEDRHLKQREKYECECLLTFPPPAELCLSSFQG